MSSSIKKHLLIDGYNIIHAWPVLKKALKEIGLEGSRTMLANIVRVIHDTEGLRLTIVFDGQGHNIKIERPTPELTFSLLYSPSGVSADALIEQLSSFPKKGQEIIVATEDSMIRQSATSFGATIISPQDLWDWVNACEKQQNQNIKNCQKSIEKIWKQQNPWDIIQ